MVYLNSATNSFILHCTYKGFGLPLQNLSVRFEKSLSVVTLVRL